jgi:hypothetical protein
MVGLFKSDLKNDRDIGVQVPQLIFGSTKVSVSVILVITIVNLFTLKKYDTLTERMPTISPGEQCQHV